MGRRFWWIIVFGIFSQTLNAQTQIIDNNPTGLKWQQLRTDHFKIIFPKGFEQKANEIANLMEHIYEPVSKSLAKQPRRIPLILQNQNSIANGFVALGPRRSEFFTTPPQDYNFLGTNEWFNLLAIHEFRHIVQFEKSLTGFNKLFYYLFGQASQSLWSNLSVPDWFWEGDAVGLETALTPSGRGRIPSFNRVFRANLLEKGGFSYNKQHLRSFKDFIPDHYRLGYFLTTHVRNEYGAESWSNITKRAFGLPFIPFTFSNALKKETGKHLVHHYAEMKDEMKRIWEEQLEGLPISDVTRVNQRKSKAFTSYAYPQLLENGNVIALKSGIGDIFQFVAIDPKGEESVVFVPGVMNESAMLSVEKDIIAWNEIFLDIRRGKSSYGVVKTYDLKTKKLRVFGEKSRYAGAALSPDANNLVTINTSKEGKYAIVIIDVTTGKEINRLKNPENYFFSMPRWTPDGKGIVLLKSGNNGKSVVEINATTGDEQILIASSHENIGHPVKFRNYLLFNSPISGIDNIYALDLNTKKRYQLTSRKYGAYNPEVDPSGEFLYFHDFGKDGFDIVKMPFDPSLWLVMENVKVKPLTFHDKIVEQEANEHILENIPNNDYTITPYRQASGFVNPHTWGPEINSNGNSIFAGVESRDVLGNINTGFGYTYDTNENTGAGTVNLSYQGLFPIIDFTYSFGNRSKFENVVLQGDTDPTRVNFRWKERTVSTGFRIPLNFVKSKYFSSIVSGSRIGLTRVKSFNQNFRLLDQISNGNLHFLEHRIQFSRQFKRSQRDLYSKWGQGFFLNYQHTPIGGDFSGKYLATELQLLFPGLFKLHSFRIKGGYQYQEIITQGGAIREGTYLFPSYFFFPRGYSALTFQKFYHTNIDYALPLFYPDLAIGPILNIQRIKANVFTDIGYGQIFDRDERFNSFGIELSADMNFFRFNQLIDLGVRINVVPELNDVNLEFTISNLGF